MILTVAIGGLALFAIMGRMIYVLVREREESDQWRHAVERAIYDAGWINGYKRACQVAAERMHMPLKRNESGEKAEWLSLQVGDKLIPRSDIRLKTHRAWYKHYPEHRQFTAGKPYPIEQVRNRTGVVFVMDDGKFRIDLNYLQGRGFSIQRANAA